MARADNRGHRCRCGTKLTTVEVEAAQRLVDAAGADFTVDRCTPMPGGSNSALFDLHDTRHDTHLVAKVYGDRVAWKLGKEAFIYGLLAPVDVPTPDVLHADDGHLLMTRLDGQPACGVTPSAPTHAIGDLWAQIGLAVRAIHRVTFDHFGYLVAGGVEVPADTNTGHMTRLLERHLRTFSDRGGDPAVAPLLQRCADDGMAHFARCRQAVLCHDDIHEANVLVIPRDGAWRISGIVDVENASASDPLFDLAKADYYARLDPLRRAALLDGYGPLPDDANVRLALYRLYHALALWAWFTEIGKTAPLPGIARDIERLAADALDRL